MYSSARWIFFAPVSVNIEPMLREIYLAIGSAVLHGLYIVKVNIYTSRMQKGFHMRKNTFYPQNYCSILCW